MSKKIIQLSTKQCPPCQEYRRKIENIIDKTDYEYEYISLYNGVEINDESFTYENYWSEINSNIKEYRKQLGLFFMSFPTFVKQDGDKLSLVPKEQIIKFLQDESK